jgi:hypothetical protein
MFLANIAVALMLLSGGHSSKATSSARIGEFLVTATRIWISESSPFPKFHYVVVEVTVKNVSERIPDQMLFPRLKVESDFEYEWNNFTNLHVNAPDFNQMLPGKKRTGAYVFDARDGTTPVALILELPQKSGRPWKKVSVDLSQLLSDPR